MSSEEGNFSVVPGNICINETGYCYDTITDAIATATNGQTVVITNGSIYRENFTIDKQITLTSNGSIPILENSIINASANNILIKRLQFRMAMNMYPNTGIILAEGTNVTVSTNSFNGTGARFGGVYCDGHNCTVINNNFTHYGAGTYDAFPIDLRGTNATVRNNSIITPASFGVIFEGDRSNVCTNHTIEENTVDGGPLYYFGTVNHTILQNKANVGALLFGCANKITVDNITMPNSDSILFVFTNNSFINNSNLLNVTNEAIYFAGDNYNNTIQNTNVSTNVNYANAIVVTEGTNGTVIDNCILKVYDTTSAIWLNTAYNTTIRNSELFGYDGSSYGLQILAGSLDTLVQNVNITSFGTGTGSTSGGIAISTFSNRTTIKDTNITAVTYGLHSYNAFEIRVYDTTVNSSTKAPVEADKTGSLYMIRSTYNRSNIGFGSDSTAQLYEQWQLTANITTRAGNPLNNANLMAWDKNSAVGDSESTNSSGVVVLELSEFLANKTYGTPSTFLYLSNYSASATKYGYSSNSSGPFNMTQDTELNLSLGSLASCWVNYTWQNIAGTETWSNKTIIVNATHGRYMAWCVYANNTANLWNGSSCLNPFTYRVTYNLSAGIAQPISLDAIRTKLMSLAIRLGQAINMNAIGGRVREVLRAAGQSIDMNAWVSKLGVNARAIAQALSIDAQGVRVAVLAKDFGQALDMDDAAARLAAFFKAVSQSLTMDALGRVLVAMGRYASQTLNMNAMAARLAALGKGIYQSFSLNAIGGRLAILVKSAAQALGMDAMTSKLAVLGRIVTQSLTMNAVRERLSGISKAMGEALSMNAFASRLGSAARIVVQLIDIDATISKLGVSTRAIGQLLDIDEAAARIGAVWKTAGQAMGINWIASGMAGFARSVGKALNINAVASKLEVLGRTVAQNLGIDAFAAKLSALGRNAIQAIGMNAVISKLGGVGRMASQAININNAASRLETMARGIVQSIGMDAIISKLGVLGKAIGQSLSINAFSPRLIVLGKGIGQLISMNTAASMLETVGRNIAQALSMNFGTTKIYVIARGIGQQLGINATATRLSINMRNVPASLSINAMAGRLRTMDRTVYEALDMNEGIARLLNIYKYVGQQITFFFSLVSKWMPFIDTQAPRYWGNYTNSTIANKQIMFAVNWTDNVELDSYIFSLSNCTGSFVNQSAVAFLPAQTVAWTNYTTGIADCDVHWKVYVNDTYGNWNATSSYFLNPKGDNETMYDVAIVLASMAMALGFCWFGINFKADNPDSYMKFLKPFFFFVGFGFMIVTVTLMRTTSLTAEASASTMATIDTLAMVMTWTFVTSLSVYMISFVYTSLKMLNDRRNMRKWGERGKWVGTS